MKKKILHLLQSDKFSGAENVVCQIIDMFKEEPDFEMVYCSADGPIADTLKEKGITFYPLKKLCISELRKVLKIYKPDIIHAHDKKAAIIASLVTKKTPVIVHMHVNANKGLKNYIKNTLWLLNACRFKHIFWVSSSAFQNFPLYSVVKSKSSILYNVINRQKVIERANEHNEKIENYDVCYVGRLTYQKDPIRLMNICAELIKDNNKIRIGIAGNGEYQDYVQNFIKVNKFEKNIMYLGFLNNPLPLIKNSKVFLMCSRFEGTPMVALEAQTLGVPIVSTPVDGMNEIIKNGENGFLSSSNKTLIYEVEEILNDDLLREKMSKQSIIKAKKFCDIDKYFYTIKKYYDSLQT